ncbi:haloacid dehalogenase-like hydrolase [Clostridium sp. 19966]|uniref:haloacid dehalogenase-like hydrolase n=1 Tax=Clostridium sp. 19966 TaxID=2768166 RepID=UPI0028E03F75|nr:haloacid dehalogenase-like hydrolase [Clostridium sp. 19966]MDT8718364.1 haloacid dehalogenase-like hydrolase [Clostridium sp. 19966]
MEQNIIAMIWDFDKTLIKGYMQQPIFDMYGIDGKEFWAEVAAACEDLRQHGVRVNNDTYYLNHFLKYVAENKFKYLNNNILLQLGTKLEFCDGLPEFFDELKCEVVGDKRYQKYNIKLEHYIVSTGLTQMIKGSKIADYVDGIWGCEFIEETVNNEAGEAVNVLNQIAYAIDNTSKTRAVFEINKGVNIFEEIDVNSKVPDKNRRVPIRNMIYIADGPSDVPVFSVVKNDGGSTFAVYTRGNYEELVQVDRLRRDGRVDMFGETDYRKDTLTHMWLTNEVKRIADEIYREHEEDLAKSISQAPRHLT